jgi:bifunctional non-homologous end joining protein LigD
MFWLGHLLAWDSRAGLTRSIPDGMLNDFEQGAIGPDLFRHACLMGLEGMVPKRADSRYRGGRSPDWIKVKNPKSPAMNRGKDAFA